MIKDHLQSEDFRELIEGEAVSTRWVERLLHLRLCDECREELHERYPGRAPKALDRLFPSLRGGCPDPDGPGGRPTVDFRRLGEKPLREASRHLQRLAEEEEAAVRLWRRFRHQEPRRWTLLVHNHPGFLTYGMVKLLLRRSRNSWHSDPRRAERLTRIALAVLERLPAGEYDRLELQQTYALAHGYLANALRARGRLAEADPILAEAWRRLPPEWSTLERAWLCRFETSLRRDQRRFSEALEAAHQAQRLFRQLRSPEAHWMVLLEAFVLKETGELEKSVGILEKLAASVADESNAGEVHFLAMQYLAISLALLGRGLEARRWLREVEARRGEFPEPLSQARLVWTRGLVEDALQRWPQAARCYRQARRVFARYENAYDVALVSLDLAAVELEMGHRDEAAKLATEMLPVFQSLRIERETLAALRLLVESVREQRATAAAVRQAAQRLRAPGAPKSCN